MRKGVVIFLVTVLINMMPSYIVKAEGDIASYETQNGVIIESSIYQRLCDIYSHNYIETIKQEEYEKIILNDLDKVEIEEYLSPEITTRGSYISTNAKTLKIIKNGNYITVMATWKGIPTIKSHDVIAVRLDNASLNGGYTFKQTYVLNGNLYTSYDSYKQTFLNGFGSSFQLQNGSNLEISLTFMIGGHGTVYGSYQHASASSTLEESKKYTISSVGYGKVINFDNSVKNKYDAMSGVDLSV